MSVIAGREKGIYAWVSANYALGTLHSDPLQTTGIIELGRASTQVRSSFPPPLLVFFWVFFLSLFSVFYFTLQCMHAHLDLAYVLLDCFHERIHMTRSRKNMRIDAQRE
jgi:hypothetical protein